MLVIDVVELEGSALTESELDHIARFKTAVYATVAPNDPPVTRNWARAEMHMGNAINRNRRLAARATNGDVLGLLGITMEMTGGNQHLGDIMLEVHPDHSWHQVGGALMARSADVLAHENRTSVAPWGVRTESTLEFWEWLEMPEVARDRMSRLTVADVDRNLMHRWRTGSLAEANGYRLVGWQGTCPEEFMPLLVEALQGMNDAPMDDLDIAHPVLDEAWNRAREESLREKDSVARVLLALDPDNQAAGMTEVVLADYRPWFAMQQGTTTLQPHRNQGVGRWLKAEMFEQLMADHPEIRVIETGNADSNAPMLAINTEMGFKRHVDLTTRQTTLTQLQQRLQNLDL